MLFESFRMHSILVDIVHTQVDMHLARFGKFANFDCRSVDLRTLRCIGSGSKDIGCIGRRFHYSTLVVLGHDCPPGSVTMVDSQLLFDQRFR